MESPIYWTTDVNAAAFGEMCYGAARRTNNSVYLTVGTGVGGGVILNKELLPGKKHLEIGHISVARKKGITLRAYVPTTKIVWRDSFRDQRSIKDRARMGKN